MNQDLFVFGSGPAFEHLKELSERAEKLPTESRELVDELLDAYSVSVEELRVAAEELNQQNAELIVSREEIERQRQRYRDLFELAPDGYLVTDPAGIIREFNQAAVNLLGISRPSLIDKPMAIFVVQGERKRFYSYLHRLVEEQSGETAEVELETRFNAQRGRSFPAALTVSPIKDSDGELTGLRWLLRDISESKRAEERERLLSQSRDQHRAAQEANRLLQALIETMPVGALIADADGMFLLTNTAGREILGTQVSGDIKSPQIDFTTYRPDGTPFPRAEMPLMRAIKDKQIVKDVEVLIQRADGGERTILSSAAPILDDEGKVVSGITIFQDITERKRSRVKLRQQAQRMEALHEIDQSILKASSVNEIGEAILSHMPQLLECNCASLTLFNTKTDEFLVLATYPAENKALWANLFDLFKEPTVLIELSRGDIYMAEDVQALHSSKWLESLQANDVQTFISAPILIDKNLIGTVNFGIGDLSLLDSEWTTVTRKIANLAAIGIRQIRQHEQLQRYATQLERTVTRRTGALRASEERFRTILEAAVFGIALLDTKGRIVQSNPALQTMTGYSETELKGMKFSDYSHPDDAKADLELYKALASLETGHYQTRKRFVRKDGQVRWSELTVSRVEQMAGNRPWLAVAIMEDITEKKKIQESLTRTERLTMAGRLGASLAHEINNPVQAVIGCLGLAEEMLEKDSKVNRYLEIAMQELERTADIVVQLRDLGHEPVPGPKEPTDLNAFVEKVLVLTRKRCQNQGVNVEWHPEADLPPVRLTPERMQQVLLNIVLNALNAMEGKGDGRKLIVSTMQTEQPKGVSVIVRDTGVGIEPDRLEHIFEPFHSSRSDGLGLGLYISKNIIEEHRGRIDVESVPGDGANFTIWLPVA